MTAASEQARLKREARFFRMFASAGVGLTLLCVGSQLVIAASPLWKGGDARQTLINLGLQLVLAAPALFYVAGLRRARRVFGGMGGGEILTPETSRGMTGVGVCLLAGALWSLLISEGLEPAQQNGPLAVYLGQIGVAARDFALAALGLALVMIGRVWAAAARLKAENDSFL